MIPSFVYHLHFFIFSISNLHVQSKGLELGFIPSLLRLLNIETDSNMKIRLVFILSTLIRNFPLAQESFLRHGGIESLIRLFDQPESNSKLQVRIIELFNDLIVEKVRKSFERLFLFFLFNLQ